MWLGCLDLARLNLVLAVGPSRLHHRRVERRRWLLGSRLLLHRLGVGARHRWRHHGPRPEPVGGRGL